MGAPFTQNCPKRAKTRPKTLRNRNFEVTIRCLGIHASMHSHIHAITHSRNHPIRQCKHAIRKACNCAIVQSGNHYIIISLNHAIMQSRNHAITQLRKSKMFIKILYIACHIAPLFNGCTANQSLNMEVY